jgi:hypothetical protein
VRLKWAKVWYATIRRLVRRELLKSAAPQRWK